MAASVNSNWAPHGPRNRRRPSRRIRLRCANGISTRFLSWRDRSNASVLANAQRNVTFPGPWAVVVDGNDNVWISKLRRNVLQLWDGGRRRRIMYLDTVDSATS